MRPPAPARGSPDPFDGAEPARPGRATERMPDPFGADDDLFQGVRPAVEWEGPSQPDNVDADAHAFAPPKALPQAAASPDDWDDLLGDTPPGAAPGPAPAPTAAAPSPAPVPTAPASTGTDAARLVQAFLDGAGVAKLNVAAHDPEAYLRAAGTLFATMVESLRDVLMSRAVVKGEFGVEQTMLRSRDNNALKFSVTPADAVAALLQPGAPATWNRCAPPGRRSTTCACTRSR